MRDPLNTILQDYGARILCLRGLVGPEEVDSLIDLLLRLDGEGRGIITIYFLSPCGASFSEVVKMADIFRTIRAKIRAVGIGVLQGAGMGIFSLCPTRILTPHSILLVDGLGRIEFPASSNRCGFSQSHAAGSVMEEALLSSLATAGEKGRILSDMLIQSGNCPRVVTATESIELGLADSILSEKKPISKKLISYGI